MEPTTASFLFADVQGYSKLEEHQVEAFSQKILPRLNRIIRDDYQKILKDINTWGDGLMIVASDPYQLARLALDIRDFYNKKCDWKNLGIPELKVRIALHHARVFEWDDPFREKKSVTGTAVTLGARLEPEITPGEVWVTEMFRNISVIRNNDAIHFEPLGMKKLAKDYDEIEVFRLCHKGEARWIRPDENTNTIPQNDPSSPKGNTGLDDKQAKKIEKIRSILEEKEAPLIPNSKDIIPSNNSSYSKNNTSLDSEEANKKIEKIRSILEKLEFDDKIQ